MPVLGRFGKELSEPGPRFSVRGVAGDPRSRRRFALGRLVPGENIGLVLLGEEEEKSEGKFGSFGVLGIHCELKNWKRRVRVS